MHSQSAADPPHLRSGQVFWIHGFPTIEGGVGKSRFVVVISPQPKLGPETTEVLVVGISSSTTAPDRIWLPNAEESPGCSTGLLTRCWAVPQWYVVVKPQSLTELRGHISKVKVDEITRAVLKRIKDRRKGR